MSKKKEINYKAMLIDGTKCTGCRGCQVACKQWNDLPAVKTEFFGGDGYQNPARLTSDTYTLIRYHEVKDEKSGKLTNWVYKKDQCQHCLEPACADACLVGALSQDDNGAVVWAEDKCIGCRYCMMACPFDIPTFEWNATMADIKKCTFCSERISADNKDKAKSLPACVKTCPTEAIIYGDRKTLLAEAKKRLAKEPDKYYQHIYGEEEVGGTCVLNINSVPLTVMGYPEIFYKKAGDKMILKEDYKKALGKLTEPAMHIIPHVVIGLGITLGAIGFIANRKDSVSKDKNE